MELHWHQELLLSVGLTFIALGCSPSESRGGIARQAHATRSHHETSIQAEKSSCFPWVAGDSLACVDTGVVSFRSEHVERRFRRGRVFLGELDLTPGDPAQAPCALTSWPLGDASYVAAASDTGIAFFSRCRTLGVNSDPVADVGTCELSLGKRECKPSRITGIFMPNPHVQLAGNTVCGSPAWQKLVCRSSVDGEYSRSNISSFRLLGEKVLALGACQGGNLCPSAELVFWDQFDEWPTGFTLPAISTLFARSGSRLQPAYLVSDSDRDVLVQVRGDGNLHSVLLFNVATRTSESLVSGVSRGFYPLAGSKRILVGRVYTPGVQTLISAGSDGESTVETGVYEWRHVDACREDTFLGRDSGGLFLLRHPPGGSFQRQNLDLPPGTPTPLIDFFDVQGLPVCSGQKVVFSGEGAGCDLSPNVAAVLVAGATGHVGLAGCVSLAARVDWVEGVGLTQFSEGVASCEGTVGVWPIRQERRACASVACGSCYFVSLPGWRFPFRREVWAPAAPAD